MSSPGDVESLVLFIHTHMMDEASLKTNRIYQAKVEYYLHRTHLNHLLSMQEVPPTQALECVSIWNLLRSHHPITETSNRILDTFVVGLAQLRDLLIKEIPRSFV